MRKDVHAVARWLDAERSYAEDKWDIVAVDAMPAEEYWAFVIQYGSRAFVLAQDGWDSPLARQALAKALRTLLAMNESMVRRYGDLPLGGVASGELTGDHPRDPF